MGNIKSYGITSPYLYIGGPNTIFGCHTEDYNLSSINVHHEGSAKFWYVFSSKDFQNINSYVKAQIPESFVECSQYMRHKTVILTLLEILGYI